MRSLWLYASLASVGCSLVYLLSDERAVRKTFLTPMEGATGALTAAAQPELMKEKYHGAYLVPIRKSGSLNNLPDGEDLADPDCLTMLALRNFGLVDCESVCRPLFACTAEAKSEIDPTSSKSCRSSC